MSDGSSGHLLNCLQCTGAVGSLADMAAALNTIHTARCSITAALCTGCIEATANGIHASALRQPMNSLSTVLHQWLGCMPHVTSQLVQKFRYTWRGLTRVAIEGDSNEEAEYGLANIVVVLVRIGPRPFRHNIAVIKIPSASCLQEH